MISQFSGPDLTGFADPAANPAVTLERAELGESADLTREEIALRFVLSLFITGDLRTITTRVALLRWLLGNDARPLAALARELGVTRARVNQIRDALAARLKSKGVRVRRREHMRAGGT